MSNNQPGNQSNEDIGSEVTGQVPAKDYDQEDYFDPNTASSMINSLNKAQAHFKRQ